MNTQQSRLDQLEWWISARSGVRASRAFAVGMLIAAITWVSAPMVVAQDPQRQMVELEQKVKATHLSLKSEAKLITALQEAVSNQASEISALLATVSNQTSQIVSLQAMVNSQTNQISGLDETVGNQAQQLGVLTNLFANFSRDGSDIYITAANLHIVNGLNSTDTTNGLGNLIVGYNELRGTGDDRSGSHNVVVGSEENFSSYGGFVVGLENSISAAFASVSGGYSNIASGVSSSVSGGNNGTASGEYSSVSGGGGQGAGEISSWSACGIYCTSPCGMYCGP